jgi:hypothetical protein
VVGSGYLSIRIYLSVTKETDTDKLLQISGYPLFIRNTDNIRKIREKNPDIFSILMII